jgi:tetratricopeptide (TPR) repeat protein
MAPEQAAGRTREVGTHTDTYALGAILYELLSGRPPFEGSSAEMIVRVQQEEAIPLCKLRPQISRDLETICLKCLTKEPGGRYASAGALADDLRRFLSGESIAARALPVGMRLLRWARRKPALAAALSLLIVAVIAGVGGTAWGLIQAREQLAQRERADQVDSMLTEGIVCIENGSFRRAIQIGEEAAEAMEILVLRNPASPWFKWHLAASYGLIGDGYRGLDDLDRAIQSYERAAAKLREFVTANPNTVQVMGMYIDLLEKVTATRYLMPDSTDAVIHLITERNGLHRRLFDSPRRIADDAFKILTNLQELGDYLLLESRASDAAPQLNSSTLVEGSTEWYCQWRSPLKKNVSCFVLSATHLRISMPSCVNASLA